jgi:hypothetical protein
MTSSNVINGQVHTRQVPYRTNLTKRLSQLKFDKQIAAYWTSDGRIFVKRTETSRKEIVTNFDDIASLECRSHRQSMRNSQDRPPTMLI